jgi:predicted peroxiredoxin
MHFDPDRKTERSGRQSAESSKQWGVIESERGTRIRQEGLKTLQELILQTKKSGYLKSGVRCLNCTQSVSFPKGEEDNEPIRS